MYIFTRLRVSDVGNEMVYSGAERDSPVEHSSVFLAVSSDRRRAKQVLERKLLQLPRPLQGSRGRYWSHIGN